MIIIGLSHHRSFTHSILGTILLSVVSFMVLQNYLSYNLIIAFITGIISHLMADYLTKQGIELFYPVSNKNYKFFITFSSGGTAESLLSLIFIFMIIKNFLVSV
jgi:inner membrane protein